MSLTEKNLYWSRIVEDIERNARQKTKRETIQNYDFSATLPESLRNRVAKILPYEFDEYDKQVFISDSEVEPQISFSEDEEAEGIRKKEDKTHVYNESTCSEIERMEDEYNRFFLNVQGPLDLKFKVKKKNNWFSSYICKSRKERVKWDSKIYNLKRTVEEKTLDEQAEELIDASAECFIKWINSLSKNRGSDMSKQYVINLFSIEGDRKLSSSILTEPKEVRAIAKTVAEKWHLPEMAIELQYENYIQELLKNAPKKIDTVAFGSTIPVKKRRWLPEKHIQPITTVFPEELLSFERIFKGIKHLRSTKELVQFYKAHPQLEKPWYLVSSGLFKEQTKKEIVTEIPLYERLKLKY